MNSGPRTSSSPEPGTAAIPIRPHTQRFKLEDANLALKALKAGTITGAGVLTL